MNTRLLHDHATTQEVVRNGGATDNPLRFYAAEKQPGFPRGAISLARLSWSMFGCLLVMSLAVHAQQPAAAPLGKVRLQLKWTHQFQFAGFYAALEKGYYRDAGLEVSMLEGRPGGDFIRQVAAGEAEYGTEMPDLLLRRNAGETVVVLGAIFQHSPLALFCRAGIKSPQDLAGRRVMMRTASEADLRAMIMNEGVALDRIKWLEHSFSLGDLVQGDTEAISGYITDHADDLRSWGTSVNVLQPINYGIDFYGDCLFTSARELSDHPARVVAFRAASLRGWDYAMEHPEEIAQLIHEKYAPKKSVAWLLAEAAAMKPLLLHKFVEIGHMNPGRWRHIGDTYVKLGMLPANYSLEGFLYNPDQARDYTGLKWLAAIMGCGFLALVLIASLLVVFNRRLNVAVQERTAELNQLNADLQTEVRDRKQAEEDVKLSEERMRLFFERQLVGMAITSPEKGWLQVNDRCCEMLGYSREELARLTWADLTYPEDLVADMAQFHRLLAGEIDDYTLEKRFVRKDGQLVHANLAVACVRRPDGAVDYVLALVEDITERKRAEEALQRSQQVLRSTFASLRDAFFVLDAGTGLITECNRAASKVFGYEVDEMLGRTT